MTESSSQGATVVQPRRLGGPAGRGARIERARDTRGTILRLTGYLRPHALMLGLVLLLTLASLVFSLLGPYLMGLAIDRYVVGRDLTGLGRIALLMLAFYAADWLSQIGQERITATVAQQVLYSLRRELFEHLQTLSLRFFDRHPHGELMSRLTNDIDNINQLLAQNITQLVSGVLTLIGLLIAMFALNLWLTLGTLLSFAAMVGFTVGVGQRTRRGFRGLQMNLGRLNAQMEETLSGQRVVQAFGQQGATLAAFDAANRAVCDAGIRAESYALLVPPLMSVFNNANTAVVAGLGGWLALQGAISVGTIATFISYVRRFANPLRHLANLFNAILAALAGAERVFEVLDEGAEVADAPEAAGLDDVKGEVRFEHVDFGYLPDVPVLKDVSLVAQPGQTIALVGPTGAGKTTIVNLLTRFYDIQAGVVSIDGLDIRQVKKHDLRRQLGIVLQDTFLFSDTVLENIRYGRLDASDEECIAAARLANADQFICRLPQGYRTPLSERGSNLSQGQRQLLAIARAVLADPRVLVLDEATSSVDTRTEVNIQEALLRLMRGRTSFVIAHRLSTIRKADLILVINAGRIIERGTHEELLAAQGFYYDMYMSQFKRQ
jgi:ATP-binding cassette subfamily B multidrug efflux pump